MACTIDATVGGASSNAWKDIASADAYHDGHVSGASWAALTTDQKCRALQQATRMLELCTFQGSRTSTGQRLSVPRTGLTDPDTGVVVDSGSIPDRFAFALFEQARALGIADRTLEQAQSVEGIKSITAGPVAIEFSGSPARPKIVTAALDFLRPWIIRYPSATTIGLRRT